MAQVNWTPDDAAYVAAYLRSLAQRMNSEPQDWAAPGVSMAGVCELLAHVVRKLPAKPEARR